MTLQRPRIDRRAFVKLAAAGLLSCAEACGRRASAEVTLGLVAPRTGERAPWGLDLERGVQLAVDLANQHGGVAGRRVRLAVEDDESHDSAAGPAVATLADREGAIAILGELSTTANEHAAQAAGRRSLPFVVAAGTHRDLSRTGEHVFRLAPTDAEQAQALARYAREVLQKRQVAVVHRRGSVLLLSIADAFAQSFRTRGGEVRLRDVLIGEDADRLALARRLKAANPDAIYIAAHGEDAARLATALRTEHVNAQLLGNDAWVDPATLREGGDAVQGALVTDLFCRSDGRPATDEFVRAFRERFHAEPGTFAALGYDAARWVLAGLGRLPVPDPRLLRDALLASQLEDGVAGTFSVDTRRVLTRAVTVLRVTPAGFVHASAVLP